MRGHIGGCKLQNSSGIGRSHRSTGEMHRGSIHICVHARVCNFVLDYAANSVYTCLGQRCLTMRGSCEIVIILLFALASSVVAQISGGAIVGTVTDPSGAAIVNAAVAATNAGTGVVNETVTNAVGRYE